MQLNHFFLLDKDPAKLVASLADPHVESMIDLCTRIIDGCYKPVRGDSLDKWIDWTLTSTDNYTFIARVRVAAYNEFFFRFGKEYVSGRIASFKSAPPVEIPEGPLTVPPINAGSLRPKDFDQAVAFARMEYMNHNAYRVRFTKRGRPSWALKEDALSRAEFAARFDEIRNRYRTRR